MFCYNFLNLFIIYDIPSIIHFPNSNCKTKSSFSWLLLFKEFLMSSNPVKSISAFLLVSSIFILWNSN